MQDSNSTDKKLTIRGQPSKFNSPEIKLPTQETLEKLYLLGLTDVQVADIIGVTRQTIENWKNPVGYDTLTGPVKRWATYVREFFPQKF